jgi:hypothetical protein
VAKRDEPHGAAGSSGAELAETILALAPRDLVFVMQFMGEAQYKVLSYFQNLVIRELEAHDIRREDHALLQIFIDKHATEMRDFVFSGVALSRPFQIDEIERLLGDTTNVLRLDIWDALRSHIEMVETRFVAQAESLPEQLAAIQAEADGYAKR